MLISHKCIKSQSSNRIFAIPHAIIYMFRLRSIPYLQISPPPRSAIWCSDHANEPPCLVAMHNVSSMDHHGGCRGREDHRRRKPSPRGLANEWSCRQKVRVTGSYLRGRTARRKQHEGNERTSRRRPRNRNPAARASSVGARVVRSPCARRPPSRRRQAPIFMRHFRTSLKAKVIRNNRTPMAAPSPPFISPRKHRYAPCSLFFSILPRRFGVFSCGADPTANPTPSKE